MLVSTENNIFVKQYNEIIKRPGNEIEKNIALQNYDYVCNYGSTEYDQEMDS